MRPLILIAILALVQDESRLLAETDGTTPVADAAPPTVAPSSPKEPVPPRPDYLGKAQGAFDAKKLKFAEDMCHKAIADARNEHCLLEATKFFLVIKKAMSEQSIADVSRRDAESIKRAFDTAELHLKDATGRANGLRRREVPQS